MEKLKLSPNKMTKYVLTNDKQFYNMYIKRRSPVLFDSIEMYREWLINKSSSIHMININDLEYFTPLLL